MRQHYHDFLNREPDPAGFRFWVDAIEEWQERLRQNVQEFTLQWVMREGFRNQFPESWTAGQFVDRLFLYSSVTPTQTERDAAVAAYGAGGAAGRHFLLQPWKP